MKQFDLTSHGSTALYQEVLHEILGDTAQMDLLDLGCGECAQSSLLPWKSATLCDVEDMPLRPSGFGTFHKGGVLDEREIFTHTYDVCYAGDVIEHLPRDEGRLLQWRMQDLLKPGGTAVIFTPLGPYMVEENATSPHQHRSGWLPEDFHGWSVLPFSQWHITLRIGALFAWYRKP